MLIKVLRGVGPWIIFSLILRLGTIELINITWISFFVLHLTFGWKSLKDFEPLPWVSTLSFLFLFCNSNFEWYYWGMRYGIQICYGMFAITAFLTVVVNKPFTLSRSKLNTPEEFWEHPFFLLINKRISMYWALSFVVNGSVMLLDYQFPWLSLIFTYLVLSSAIVFSDLYPGYFQAKAKKRQIASQQSALV